VCVGAGSVARVGGDCLCPRSGVSLTLIEVQNKKRFVLSVSAIMDLSRAEGRDQGKGCKAAVFPGR